MAARYIVTRFDADKSIVSEQLATNLDHANELFTETRGHLKPAELITLFDARKDVNVKTYRRSTREEIVIEIEKGFARVLDRVDSERIAIDQFITRLQNNPFEAFSWSAEAFVAAAKLSVLGWVRAMRDEHQTRDAIIEELRARIIRGARYPGRSTSQQSNLIAQDQLAALVEMHEALQGVRSWRDSELAKF